MGMYVNERGDELWFGMRGPIPIVEGSTAQRARYEEAGKIAQAAVSLPELVSLVSSHENPLVRSQAVPRLAARFPGDRLALETLLAAVGDADRAVRYEAVVALADVGSRAVLDAIAGRLEDDEATVRLVAAEVLRDAHDPRAPEDPETWAYDPFTERPSGK